MDNLFGMLEFSAEKIKFKIGLEAHLVANLIYYDTLASPVQLNSSVDIFAAYLKQDFKLWKLRLDNKLVYQYVSNTDAVALPDLISYHSLYVDDEIFKDKLGIQIGADVYFNTSYYPREYMAASGHFYTQSTKKIGDYPFIDLFLSMKVSRARMCAKAAHVNAGLMGSEYYSAPRYPAAGRTFIVGVSWVFFN